MLRVVGVLGFAGVGALAIAGVSRVAARTVPHAPAARVAQGVVAKVDRAVAGDEARPRPRPMPRWQVPAVDERADSKPVGAKPWITTTELVLGADPVGVAYSPDGAHLFVAHREGLLQRWDVDNERVIWRWHAPDRAGLTGLAAGPRGEWVVAFGPGGVHVLGARDGKLVRTLEMRSKSRVCPGRPLEPVQAQLDGAGGLYVLYMTAAGPPQPECPTFLDNTIVRWDLRGGAAQWHHILKVPPCKGEGRTNPNWCVVPSPTLRVHPDAPVVAGAGCDGSVFLLDKQTGREVARQACPALQPGLGEDAAASLSAAEALGWSKDGRRLYASFGSQADGVDGLPQIRYTVAYDLAADADLELARGGEGPELFGPPAVLAELPQGGPELASSPDGAMLAQALGGAGVFVHDVRSGKLVHRTRSARGQVAWNPQRRELATLTARGVALHHERAPVRLGAGQWTPTRLWVRVGQTLRIESVGDVAVGVGARRGDSGRRSGEVYAPAFLGDPLGLGAGGELMLDVRPTGSVTIHGGKTEDEWRSVAALRARLSPWGS